MRRQTILAAAVSALAVALAGPTLAQAVQPLAPGQVVEGAITGDDPAVEEGDYRYDDYAVQARAGQRFEAILRAEGFDAFLEVFSPDDAIVPVSFDDDGLGEGTDSRLRFTADRRGTWILRARPLSGGEGDYALSLTERPPAPRAPRPTGIRVGQTMSGEISARDPEAEDGVPYDAFSFRAREGDRIAIALDSEAFDPVLRIGRMEGGAFVQLAENDDGADSGLNSRLVFTAPAAGDYLIRAAPYGPDGAGDYTLSLREAPPPLAAQVIAVGDTVEGRLTEDDAVGERQVRADIFRFEGREGQRLRIDMSSEDFDPYLELFDAMRAPLVDDDDGGPAGLDARIDFTLPAAGSYYVEARAYAEATGAYRLTISEQAPEPAPRSIAFGATIEGEISEDDPRDRDDRGYDAFTFQGVEGQRIQATLRSGDFDAVLQIGLGAEEFSALASDDDGLMEGTDSRLNFTLPEDGEYVLRALTYRSDSKGLYALELIDRGPRPLPGGILIGSTAWGTLSETDAANDRNALYDAYRITAREDDKLLITMVSNDFDSFVVVGRIKADGEFEELALDDDGLTDTHARLEWTVPSDGAFEIRAGAFSHGQSGPYALTVEKTP